MDHKITKHLKNVLKWPKSCFGHKIANYNKNVIIFGQKFDIYGRKLKISQKLKTKFGTKCLFLKNAKKFKSPGILICFWKPETIPAAQKRFKTRKMSISPVIE